MPEPTNSAQLTLALALSPWRERPELLSRLAPLNPLASGARDVPARSGSECNRRLGKGSRTSRLSEPLRPGTGRAPERATSRRAAGPNAIGDLERVPARAGCRSRCDRGPVALRSARRPGAQRVRMQSATWGGFRHEQAVGAAATWDRSRSKGGSWVVGL